MSLESSAASEPFRQAELVGRKIRQLRKERKLTQSQLAARIGIQQSDLSRMEQGQYRVSLDTLFQILAEFDISLAEFFDESQAQSFTPKDLLLVREFRALPETAKAEVESFIGFKSRRPPASSRGEDQDGRRFDEGR